MATALTAVRADYFLGGSLASSLQGEPRATNDIDFVIALPAGRVNALRDAFPVVVTASGESIVVKRAEDTVLRKLLWFREGGEVSEKQWRDVVSVLRISGNSMDDAYLSSWASRLKIESLLNAARQARSPELPGR